MLTRAAMSDNEDEEVVVEEEEEEEITDLISAIKKVLKNAMISDGVVRGLHGVAKALDAKKAQVCFLAENCSEPAYKKLVQALCAEHAVPLVEVSDNKELGQWAGLCKVDKDGNPRKVVGASCVCITDYGEESAGLTFLQAHLGE